MEKQICSEKYGRRVWEVLASIANGTTGPFKVSLERLIKDTGLPRMKASRGIAYLEHTGNIEVERHGRAGSAYTLIESPAASETKAAADEPVEDAMVSIWRKRGYGEEEIKGRLERLAANRIKFCRPSKADPPASTQTP